MANDNPAPAADIYDADGETLPDTLPNDPFPLFKAWFDDAQRRRDQPNPNAFTLATVGSDGAPAARIVLCKGMDADDARITFYTNYQGRKGSELTAHPIAAACFHWDHADRQVRIEGPIVQSPAEESDAYFASRRWESRLGAWASQQSESIESREALLIQVAQTAIDLDLSLPDIMAAAERGEPIGIPRPPHWGGFRLYARSIELWCGGTGRVHDRARWTRELTINDARPIVGPWGSTRLQP